jgi:hypothetical protein
LAATAVLVNLLCVTGIVAIVYRRAGQVASLWAAAVLLVHLRVLGANALQDFWNPTISILPFALFLFCAWSVLCEERWMLPVMLGVGSFVMQCHAGYVVPVGVIGLVSVARSAMSARRDHSWYRPLGVGAVVVAMLWSAPVIDELTGHPGNLTAFFRYARATSGSWGWREGTSAVLSQLGRLPAWLVGRHTVPHQAASPTLPLWPSMLGIVALLMATVAAVRRRQTELVWLSAVIALAAITAATYVERIQGPIFTYLVDWISSIGVVLWIAVGIGATNLWRPGRKARCSARIPVAMVGLLATALAVGATWNVLAAPAFGSSTSPDIVHLAAAARQWVGPRRAVKVDFGADRQQLVGTGGVGSGVVLQLERRGIATKVDPSLHRAYGASRIVDEAWTGPRLLIGTTDQPPPGSQRLTTSGRYTLYALS